MFQCSFVHTKVGFCFERLPNQINKSFSIYLPNFANKLQKSPAAMARWRPHDGAKRHTTHLQNYLCKNFLAYSRCFVCMDVVSLCCKQRVAKCDAVRSDYHRFLGEGCLLKSIF